MLLEASTDVISLSPTTVSFSVIGAAVAMWLLQGTARRYKRLEEGEAGRVQTLEHELGVEREERKRESAELRAQLDKARVDYARCEVQREALQRAFDDMQGQLRTTVARIQALEERLLEGT